MNEFFGSFLPALSRVRREARIDGGASGNQEADYLDHIVTGMGALMDRQSCRLRVTCNAGKVIQNNIPGAQVAVMLLESLVPQEWRVQIPFWELPFMISAKFSDFLTPSLI